MRGASPSADGSELGRSARVGSRGIDAVEPGASRRRRPHNAGPRLGVLRPLVVSVAMASLVSVQATAVERGTLPPRYQGIAAAQCLRDLDSFDRTLHESGFGVVAPEKIGRAHV